MNGATYTKDKERDATCGGEITSNGGTDKTPLRRRLSSQRCWGKKARKENGSIWRGVIGFVVVF